MATSPIRRCRILPSNSTRARPLPSGSNAFLLAVVVFVVPLSSFVDIIGYKRVYQIGLALFTLASFGCSLPHSLNMLILARTFQGVGAACIWSTSAAVMRYTYPRDQLGRGIGLGGMVVFTSAAAGPSVASGILAIASWHWLFAVNIPFGLLSLSLSERFLAHAEGTRHRFDVWSAVLNAAAVTLLVLGIDGIGDLQHVPILAAELIGSLFFWVLVVRRQLLLQVPMLAIDLFKRRIFALSVSASLFTFMGQGLAFVVLPFYFVDALGFSRSGPAFCSRPGRSQAVSRLTSQVPWRIAIL